MAEEIYLATRGGLATCRRDSGAWSITRFSLEDHNLTCVLAQGDTLLAGTTDGVFRSQDGGESWQRADEGLAIKHIRWLASDRENPDLVLAGTEPAGIFVSRDGAKSWRAHPEVESLRDEHGWMLPYSPEAGCVRGFALHGQRLYAAVEVGGVLRSDDGGESWDLVPGSSGSPSLGHPREGFVFPDVHDVAVHPSSPDLIWAATGGGLYRSQDGGGTWQLRYDCYCRGLWLDPDDRQHVIFGPAEYVGAQGRIERSRDGGGSWYPASGQLEVPWPNTMPERFAQAGEELFAVLDDGRLLVASLDKLEWRFILPDTGGVNAVTAP